jgi:hypothetical protein
MQELSAPLATLKRWLPVEAAAVETSTAAAFELLK